MNNVYHHRGLLLFRFEAVHWVNDSAIVILAPCVVKDDKAQCGGNGRRAAGWRIVLTLRGGLPREAASELARRLNEAMRCVNSL